METKELILKHAEMLFGTRGFRKTKIADISGRVGISDSTIYEHFANKKTILFEIPKKRIQAWRKSNLEHLNGLVGAEVKLRKLVWNYMSFFAKSKEWTNIVLFALASNRDFFQNESHHQIKDALRLYREVIIEGQQAGEFDCELSPSLVLHFIIGAIHQISITWLTENRPSDPFDLFEEFFDLIIHGLRQEKTDSAENDRKMKIMTAALEIFATVGYEKARIQDIARLACVGDGTIYKFFKSKEDILFTLTLKKSTQLVENLKKHLGGDIDPAYKLVLLLRDYLSLINTEKAYGVLFHFDLRHNRSYYDTGSYQSTRQFTRMFYDAILEGVAINNFRPGIKPYIALKMIMGVFDQLILSRLMYGYPENFVALSDDICGFVLKSLKVAHHGISGDKSM